MDAEVPGRLLDIKTPRAFVPLLAPRRYKGAKGGRGGAKSHFFCEGLVEEMATTHTRVVCLREVQNSIKDSVKQLVEDKIRVYELESLFKITETEIIGPYESLMIFKGLQNHTASSIKSLEGFNRAFVEEAQTVSQRSLDLLIPTIRSPGSELRFGWNPSSPKDPVDKMFAENEGDPDFVLVTVTYEDNPWFPDELRRDMERDKRRDPDKYAHIWLGDYQKHSEARVFQNWKVEPFDTPADARFYFGADWGFSVDPSVLVRMFIDGRTLYIDKEAYQVGCEIDKTPALFDQIDGSREWPVTADSARPETISYMQRHGFPRLKPARKGPGSLEDGIEFLKSYDIVVHPDCKHVADELALYAYKVDKVTEEVLPQLDDKENHVIDAMRYALEDVRRAKVHEEAGLTSVIHPTQDIPGRWVRTCAIDIDGQHVSVVWGAMDRTTQVMHLYDEMIAPRQALAIHAAALKKRGAWIPVLFDLEARTRTNADGQALAQELADLGVELFAAGADPEAGVSAVDVMIAEGRLQVFDTLAQWPMAYRAYHRDDKGVLPKDGHGLMRATQLIALYGAEMSVSENQANSDGEGFDPLEYARQNGELGITGY